MPTHIAVITGDINGSSFLDKRATRHLIPILNVCFDDVCEKLPYAKAGGFTTFLGDSWQFYVSNPVLAIRAIFLFRVSLLIHGDDTLGKKLHSSAAIGFGRINSHTDHAPNADTGTAYELSGKKLSKLRRRVPGMVAAGLGDTDHYLDSMLGLFDALIRRLTFSQAQALSLALSSDFSQEEIARRLKPRISQQAVNKHLRVAGWPAIKPALNLIETTVKFSVHEHDL